MHVTFVVANGLFGKKSCAAIAIEAGFIGAMAIVMVAVRAILQLAKSNQRPAGQNPAR